MKKIVKWFSLILFFIGVMSVISSLLMFVWSYQLYEVANKMFWIGIFLGIIGLSFFDYLDD